jgi:hypothetical protein
MYTHHHQRAAGIMPAGLRRTGRRCAEEDVRQPRFVRVQRAHARRSLAQLDLRRDVMRARTGTAAMELAFILPVLIGLVLLSVDLGRGTHYDLVLSNAAREGAAWGATHRATDYTLSDWEDEVEQRVEEEAAHLPGFDADDLQVDIEIVAQLDGSNRIEVEAVYPFEMMLDWPGYPQTIELRRRVAMQEYR